MGMVMRRAADIDNSSRETTGTASHSRYIENRDCIISLTMPGEIWKIGDWSVFPAENTLRRDGSEVKVPPRLMDALIFFARHPDHVISRTELVAHLWNRSVVTDQTVTQNIFELRKALRDGRGRQEAPEYIATVPKRGYQLVAGAELLRCAQEEELAQDSDISADTSDIAAEASEAAVAGQRKSGKKRSKFIDFLRALSFWMKLN